jgi:hypothetical protein
MISIVEPLGTGAQTCANCKLTFPNCGKKKPVRIGYCRYPFQLEVNGENHLPFASNAKKETGDRKE